MNSSSISIQQVREKLMRPRAKRVLMHIGFWILWLSRTFYDIISLYGVGLGECLFMLVYAATQIPMMYFHLYVLVPKLLNRRYYVLYGVSTVALVFSYSYVNYTLLTMIPANVSSAGLMDYIGQLNPRYDIFEGFFTLVITYALKYAGQAVSSQNKLLQLQKDNLILELNALKSQINPHFLFNTLNNIYSLSLRKSDKAPEMILKLSDMMRYVLYECNSGAVPIEKEIQFIKNYMDLERLRHGAEVKIQFTLNGNPGQNKIEPLLLIPIVENSFKHGINNQLEKGFIEIQMEVKDKKLSLQAYNSVQNGKRAEIKHGIGIDNVRKRLELLYPENHRLQISPNEKTWKVNLELNLS
jgi:sensor histidine kinase YesM